MAQPLITQPPPLLSQAPASSPTTATITNLTNLKNLIRTIRFTSLTTTSITMPGLITHSRARTIAPLESDPAIFTTLLHALGAPQNLHFIDILSLSSPPPNILGAVVIAPWSLTFAASIQADELQTHGRDASTTPPEGKPVWLKQTLQNTCGFHALLHCMLNLPGVACPEGSLFAKVLAAEGAEERRKTLEESEDLERAYTEVSRLGQTDATQWMEPNNHYYAFVSSEGKIWEMTGERWGAVERTGDGIMGVVKDEVEGLPEGERGNVAVLGLVSSL